jgi:hypothetical protein
VRQGDIPVSFFGRIIFFENGGLSFVFGKYIDG